jgi:hypothetical protein
MTKTQLQLLAMLSAVSGCGAPIDSASSAPEPVAEVEQPIQPIYPIAVIQLSQTSNTSLSVASFGTFPADIARISSGKTAVQMDFYGPYHATPAQIGCNGDSNHDGPLLRAKALSMLSVNLLNQYKHVWFSNAYDLSPACNLGGASGGNYGMGFPNGSGYRLGYVTQWSNNEVAVHEFLHGIDSLVGNTHMRAVLCMSGAIRTDNAACTFSEINPGGAPQGAWALGASTFGQGSSTFNLDPVHKIRWTALDWIPTGNIGGMVAAVGTYTFTLYPSDAPLPAAGNYTTVHLILPYFNTMTLQERWLWFDYRQHAEIGINHEDRPGVYVYYEEQQRMTPLGGTQPIMSSDVSLVRLGTNSSNYSGLMPIPVSQTMPYTIPGEPNVTVQVPSTCGATCQLIVKINGPVL